VVQWKLNPIQAAKDFLPRSTRPWRPSARAPRPALARRRLRDEALEYLVVVFTEDRSVSAKEVFDFLASIGGEQYSRDVLLKVAESYGAQTEWDRSNEAYRFLIKMDPESIKSAEYQRDIVANWNSALDVERAQDEIKILLQNHGPNTAWAKAQKNRDALARSLQITEDLTRTTATNIHGEAQRREKGLKLPKPDGCATQPYLPGDLSNLYTRAADAYESYLDAFEVERDRGQLQHQHTIEVRYYHADILCFVAKVKQAGDEYCGRQNAVNQAHGHAAQRDSGIRRPDRRTRSQDEALRRRQEVRRGDRPLRDAVPG
jgi:hypothetical protein